MNSLHELTKALLHLVHQANEVYHKNRREQTKGDFYQEVKPFADQARQLSEKWEQAVMKEMKRREFKYVHPPQIKATLENIELISVQAFFPETSYTRFKNYVESTIFILEQLQRELD
ncbi:DUF1798 family protein [Bacillus xiapuensis]|uniref:DUF1798 family protein n=1 Tax=Bacillus xiapuensis TaxID=2014075 RepID=UPI000C24AFAA|nr:DUF1798 family protein [Bacillus xiapuensis]